MKDYRKVVVVGGIALLSFAALMLTTKLDGDNFTVIATAAISAFSIANAVEHRSRMESSEK